MPSHQDRREPLPKDYQFGDARPLCEHDYRARWRDDCGFFLAICDRCGHEAGEVELRGVMSIRGTGNWNVIEGEHFASGSLLVEKCTDHGRERMSDCAECQSLPRLDREGESH